MYTRMNCSCTVWWSPGRPNFRRIMNGSLGTSVHNIYIFKGTFTPRRECNEAMMGQDNESVDGDEDEPSWRLVNDMNYIL